MKTMRDTAICSGLKVFAYLFLYLRIDQNTAFDMYIIGSDQKYRFDYFK